MRGERGGDTPGSALSRRRSLLVLTDTVARGTSSQFPCITTTDGRTWRVATPRLWSAVWISRASLLIFAPPLQGYLAVFALGFQAVHFVATRHLVHITR